MNILLITDGSLDVFGRSTHMYNTTRALGKLGHDVCLVCRRMRQRTAAPRYDASDMPLREVGGPSKLSGLIYPIQLLFHASYHLTHSKPDVVYERAGTTPVGFILSKLFHRPLVVAAQGIHPWESEARHKSLQGRPVVTRLAMVTSRHLTWLNYRAASRVIAVTPEIKSIVCNQYGVSTDKVVVGRNGADTELFRPMPVDDAKRATGLLADKEYVCFVGGLNRWTGLEHLIQCAPLVLKRCPAARFLIVGDGEERRALTELASRVGLLDKFLFTGAVPYQRVPDYINSSRICVEPSMHPAKKATGASSLKVFEYMACGKPAVTGNTPGDRDRIAASGAGYAVDSGNATDLAGAITHLLKNQALADRLGQRGRQFVVEHHSWQHVAQRVAAVCAEAPESH
jgi:glycosyltransferase involved in cell wall biosynthesis